MYWIDHNININLSDKLRKDCFINDLVTYLFKEIASGNLYLDENGLYKMFITGRANLPPKAFIEEMIKESIRKSNLWPFLQITPHVFDINFDHGSLIEEVDILKELYQKINKHIQYQECKLKDAKIKLLENK